MKIYRVVRWFMLAGAVLVIFLALKSPAPVALPLTPLATKERAASFKEKMERLQTAQAHGQAGMEARFTAAEVNAALAQDAIAQPAATVPISAPASDASPGNVLPIKSTQVNFEGDQVMGQFLTHVYGRDVFITIAGRLGVKDGYATFSPTEFKIGDLSVPVSLVDPQLQKKLTEPENREKLKLPDFVKSLRVENSQLVVSD